MLQHYTVLIKGYIGQSNQTQRASWRKRRSKDTSTHFKRGVVEVTCQSAIPATCHHLPYGLRRRISAESF